MAFTGITRVTKTVGSSGVWTDIDVSADVPAGATGIFGEIEVISGNRNVGARMNGSTDNRTNTLGNNSHNWFTIGVDSSRIFEGYASDSAQVKWHVDGYFTTDATFNSNAVDKSLSTTGSWTDINISTDTTGTAVGAFIEKIHGGSFSRFWGLRNNGSTDNRTNESSTASNHIWGFVGVDGSEILEGYVETTEVDFFLVGYVTTGYTPKTNATDISTSTTGVYVDLPAIDSGATGGTVEVITSFTNAYNLRKNGNTTDVYREAQWHHWWIGESDSSQLIEGKIQATDVDFFLTGYFTAVSAESGPRYISATNTVVKRKIELVGY